MGTHGEMSNADFQRDSREEEVPAKVRRLTRCGFLPRSCRMIIRFLAALLLFGSLGLAEEDDEAAKKVLALIEKHVSPLLREADQMVIYSLYPIPQEELAKEIDGGELATAFAIYDEKEAAKLDPADRAVAKFARTAETIEG